MKLLALILFVAGSTWAQIEDQNSPRAAASPAGFGFNSRPTGPLNPRPQNPYNYFRILKQNSNSYPNGYEYSFATDNQIQAQEVGEVLENDPYEDERGFGTHARGFFEYIGDDGNLRRSEYTADENGYNVINFINGQLQDSSPLPRGPIASGPANLGQTGPSPRLGGQLQPSGPGRFDGPSGLQK